MTPTPTPGQVAYAAYCRMVYGAHVRDGDAAALTWGQQAAWEAAAQAVLDACQPRFQFALGQLVRRASDPAQRWEIWWRSCREELGRTYLDYGLRLVDPASDYQPCRMSDGTDLVPEEETR